MYNTYIHYIYNIYIYMLYTYIICMCHWTIPWLWTIFNLFANQCVYDLCHWFPYCPLLIDTQLHWQPTWMCIVGLPQMHQASSKIASPGDDCGFGMPLVNIHPLTIMNRRCGIVGMTTWIIFVSCIWWLFTHAWHVAHNVWQGFVSIYAHMMLHGYANPQHVHVVAPVLIRVSCGSIVSDMAIVSVAVCGSIVSDIAVVLDLCILHYVFHYCVVSICPVFGAVPAPGHCEVAFETRLSHEQTSELFHVAILVWIHFHKCIQCESWVHLGMHGQQVGGVVFNNEVFTTCVYNSCHNIYIYDMIYI